ncbi:hypothetical protein C7B76_23125 [filamentous cyanobacterium CCP2]|nr:hypothetical protein C7B76_23125 [filamentous cyanobacterium CCP2]
MGLLSAVSVIFIGFATWFFKRTLSEAKQEVEQLVRAEVKREIARNVKQRIELLEQILEREEVPSLVTIDYVLQNTAGTLPKEYRLLQARFPRLKLHKLTNQQFNGQVVVLDLVNYQPAGSELTEAEVEQILQSAIDKLLPNAVLSIYIRGRYKALDALNQKNRYYTFANVPTQLLGNVINSAYVAHTL